MLIYQRVVVLTILKNIHQLGLLFPIYGKIKKMFQISNQWWEWYIQPPKKVEIYQLKGWDCEKWEVIFVNPRKFEWDDQRL